MRLALIVEYEGTNYHGFQYQSNAASIQEELETAITRFTGESVRIRGAGRTDAGVHAKGQVVAFDTASAFSTDTFVRALNHYLPNEIAVKEAYRVRDGFDPRRNALSRSYRYTILNRRAPSPLLRRTTHQWSEPLDVGAMKEVAGLFVGEHDFARFCGPLGDKKRRTIRRMYEVSVFRESEIVTIDAKADSFLPHQVRRMAGSLVEVGRNNLSLGELKCMISGERVAAVAHSLPARGLCLIEVSYADFPPKVGETDGNKHQAISDARV